jgi:hypothetical protein
MAASTKTVANADDKKTAELDKSVIDNLKADLAKLKADINAYWEQEAREKS